MTQSNIRFSVVILSILCLKLYGGDQLESGSLAVQQWDYIIHTHHTVYQRPLQLEQALTQALL